MTDTAAATRALLMNLAGPRFDRAATEALIRDTYTDPDKARYLAHATAEAIAEKLDTTPLALRLNTAVQQHAYLLIAAHDMRDPDAAELLDGLSTDHLAGVCIALLGMWRGACAAAARVALRDAHASGWPSAAPWSDERAPGDQPDRPAQPHTPQMTADTERTDS